MTFEEKIERMERGLAPSPECVLETIRAFKGTNVAQALDLTDASLIMRRKLSEIIGKSGKYDIRTFTMGDLASILYDYYCVYEVKDDENIRKLLCIYLYVIESIYDIKASECSEGMSPEAFRYCCSSQLVPILDFVELCYEDYKTHCDSLKIPNNLSRSIPAFIKARCILGINTLGYILDDMKYFCLRDTGEELPFDFGKDENIYIKLYDCITLIEFFVVPVACTQ